MGASGPQYVAEGVVLYNGTFAALSESPGVSVSVTRLSAGAYLLTATGLGNQCPIPMLNPVNEYIPITTGSDLTCGAGSLSTQVLTQGTDEDWSFLIVGA